MIDPQFTYLSEESSLMKQGELLPGTTRRPRSNGVANKLAPEDLEKKTVIGRFAGTRAG